MPKGYRKAEVRAAHKAMVSPGYWLAEEGAVALPLVF